jgi:hypothetical protein
MNEIKTLTGAETEFLIYLDILGFDKIARQISENSKVVSERKVREDFIRIINQKIDEAAQRGEIIGRNFSQRDDWLLAVKSIDLVFKVVYEILNHSTDYKGYEKIPLEIAIGFAEYDKWAKLSGASIVYENSTIDFLKTHLTDVYRKWYKDKYAHSIFSSFVVFTEAVYNIMGYFDKKLCRKVDSTLNGQEPLTFFVATEMLRVIERGKVLCFLQKIGKTNRSWFRRINCAFVPPNEYESILNTLEQEKVLFLVGDPEIGKTYTATRILWEYYLKGYNPVWNPGAEDQQRELARQKLSEFSIDNQTVTYFEDPFGARKYEDNCELTKTIINTILRVQHLDARVIISSREELFKHLLMAINSEHDLSRLIVALRLMKPSYTEEKMTQIILNWAKEFDCAWLDNPELTTYVLSQARRRLSTPFSLWDFASSSVDCTTLSELNALFNEKSTNVKLSFAEEIAHMPQENILFLSLAVILSQVNSQIVKSSYIKAADHFNLSSSLETIAKHFEVKVSLEQGTDKKEYFHFTHPSYEEAVVNSWNRPEVKNFILNTFNFLVNSEDPLVRGCCGLSLVKNYNDISFKDEARELCLKLLCDKRSETRLGVVIGLEYSFKNIPMARGIEFVRLMMKDKNSDVRHRAICIIGNNFNIIPVKESIQILTTALEDRAAWVRFEAVLFIQSHVNLVPTSLVQKALMVNEKLSRHRGWTINYLSGFISDDLFRPYEEARNRIEQVEDQEMKMYLKAVYLLAAEGSELTGMPDSGASGFHRTRKIVYGPRGTDVSCSFIEGSRLGKATNTNLSLKFPIALFKVKSARQDLEDDARIPFRIVALPMSEQIDPWVRELYDFFRAKGDEYVFPFNRHKAWRYITSHHVFEGLTYRIREYKYARNNLVQFLVFQHVRKVKLLGLRRLRIYEFIDKYNFDGADLEIYSGINSKKGKTNPILDQDWHRYIHKLCISD